MDMTEALNRVKDLWERCKLEPSSINLTLYEEAVELLYVEIDASYADFEQAQHQAENEIYQD